MCIFLIAGVNAGAQNLLKNGDFEESIPNGTFPTAFWQPSYYPETAGAVVTTTAAQNGKCGLWIYTSGGSSNSKPFQDAACTAMKNYKAEASLRSPKGQNWTKGTKCYISITFLNKTGIEIESAKSETLTTGNSDWKLFSVSKMAPKGSVKVRFAINIESENGQSICNADNCSLTTN